LKSLTAIASMMVDPASIPKRWRGSGGIRGSGSRLVLLAPLYGWFTEGFDMLDLKEAEALLGVLHA